MSVPSRALTCLVASNEQFLLAAVYIPPDVCIETSAERVRSILETTRQDSRPLVKLCFLFVGIHVIKSDGLTNAA